eukprot:Platyproteum_vivax@DN3564_c0_g1_i1.p1
MKAFSAAFWIFIFKYAICEVSADEAEEAPVGNVKFYAPATPSSCVKGLPPSEDAKFYLQFPAPITEESVYAFFSSSELQIDPDPVGPIALNTERLEVEREFYGFEEGQSKVHVEIKKIINRFEKIYELIFASAAEGLAGPSVTPTPITAGGAKTIPHASFSPAVRQGDHVWILTEFTLPDDAIPHRKAFRFRFSTKDLRFDRPLVPWLSHAPNVQYKVPLRVSVTGNPGPAKIFVDVEYEGVVKYQTVAEGMVGPEILPNPWPKSMVIKPFQSGIVQGQKKWFSMEITTEDMDVPERDTLKFRLSSASLQFQDSIQYALALGDNRFQFQCLMTASGPVGPTKIFIDMTHLGIVKYSTVSAGIDGPPITA